MTKEVWIADDDASIGWVIEKAMKKHGYYSRKFDNGESLLSSLNQTPPDLIISDIRMPGLSGFELLKEINQRVSDLPVIIMTAFGDLDSAVDSFKYGAYEYLTKPFDIDELVGLVEKALAQKVQQPPSSETPKQGPKFLGESAQIQEVFRTIGRIGRSNMGVLIRGESGVGKELVAEAVHKNSSRSAKSLVAINTAAIPSELLESELFGHEKGAFTGATSQHIGRFEQADGATLFLDEIGDMPAGLQTRLLRVLSEGRFYRVGGRQEIQVDVRIIAATNQDLESLVEQGKFRNDLFHRLNVLAIIVPPLRERLDDILLLLNYYLEKYSLESGVKVKIVRSEVIDLLQKYQWPGNVRELQNLVQQLIILSPGHFIGLTDLPDHILSAGLQNWDDSWQHCLKRNIDRRLRLGEAGIGKELSEAFDKVLIESALEYSQGHKQKAAKALGWGRNTLSRKLAK